MRVVVCGAGQVGTTIARHLASEDINVTVIDIDQEQIRHVDESYDVRGVIGHASHPATLQEAGARDADMLIAVTRSDEVNMVACQVAYSLFRVKRRIARLRHAGYLEQDKSGLYAAEHLPIDIIISPEIEIAEGIAHRLRTPGAFDRVPMAGGLVELLGIHSNPDSGMIGRPFAEITDQDAGVAMNVLAVVRNGRSFVPEASDCLTAGDDVYALTRNEHVDDVIRIFGHQKRAARKIIIVGGGNVGLHLTRKILREFSSIDVKLIEQDRDRATAAASEFGDAAIVLNGDALDKDLLAEAQAGSADAIVAVTNDDEANIFVSVLAKQAGCHRAITLVNKPSYENLIPTLGIDAVVSPSAVTISTVLRHVRRGTICGLYTLREDFGEVIEAEISAGSRLLRRSIGDLGLPSGMKIGAIVRNDQVIMPNDAMKLEVGDHVIALVAYSYLRLAETLLGKRRRPFG